MNDMERDIGTVVENSTYVIDDADA